MASAGSFGCPNRLTFTTITSGYVTGRVVIGLAQPPPVPAKPVPSRLLAWTISPAPLTSSVNLGYTRGRHQCRTIRGQGFDPQGPQRGFTFQLLGCHIGAGNLSPRTVAHQNVRTCPSVHHCHCLISNARQAILKAISSGLQSCSVACIRQAGFGSAIRATCRDSSPATARAARFASRSLTVKAISRRAQS